jgi:hypothetical protein
MHADDALGISLFLQPERNLPAPTTLPASPSGVLKVISGRKPIMTNDPAEYPLQWLHRFVTPAVGMMTELDPEGKRAHKLSSKQGLSERVSVRATACLEVLIKAEVLQQGLCNTHVRGHPHASKDSERSRVLGGPSGTVLGGMFVSRAREKPDFRVHVGAVLLVK